MAKRSKSLKNGNKALQGFLGLVVLAGAVLGLTAFILHFTNKGGCGEGYKHEETAENCTSPNYDPCCPTQKPCTT